MTLSSQHALCHSQVAGFFNLSLSLSPSLPPSLSDFLPRCQSHSSLALSPRLAAGDELELELLPRLADDGGVMEPMNVDNGGCGGLDAQIEQLMQCRPLAEQEVRSSSAMSRFHSGFRYARWRFCAAIW